MQGAMVGKAERGDCLCVCVGWRLKVTHAHTHTRTSVTGKNSSQSPCVVGMRPRPEHFHAASAMTVSCPNANTIFCCQNDSSLLSFANSGNGTKQGRMTGHIHWNNKTWARGCAFACFRCVCACFGYLAPLAFPSARLSIFRPAVALCVSLSI